MAATATVPFRVYILTRKNPETGFKQIIHYTGNIKQKPKGWFPVEEIPPINGNGLI